jgi:iron complex transport system substrate-binding protein
MKCLWAVRATIRVAVFLAMTVGSHADAHDTRRIVSVGSDVTETLYALGFADRIVAVDTTSQHPPEALKTKPNVGYMRALSPEGVISAGGTLIIASDKAGPPDVVRTLKTSVAYAEVVEGAHPEAVPEKIRAIAKIVGAEDAGEKLAAGVEQDLRALANERSKISNPLRTLFVLNMQGSRMVVAGAETNADAMLRLSGLLNVGAALKGYKPIGDEALIAMSPDLVLIMRAGGGHDTGSASASSALAATPAGKTDRIRYVDAGNLLSFGPRIATLARDLMRSSYSDR